MQMTNEMEEKLKRYILNADPFLWNILSAKTKKERIIELQGLGSLKEYSLKSNYIYKKINHDLLVELGPDGIIEHIVVPCLMGQFKPEMLQYFRRCWREGDLPSLNYLKENKLYRRHIFTEEAVRDGIGTDQVVGHKDRAFIFVQIDTQHEFIERWTVFAGLWFEEIEPRLGTGRESSPTAAND